MNTLRAGWVITQRDLAHWVRQPWAPIFNLGASYAINKQWALTATVSYLPLKTEAATVIKASDGTTLATTKTTLKANPIITFVGVSYKF